MKTKEEVLALLVELGSSAQEIAAKLQSLGIRGRRHKCRSCPIAQYLVANGVGVEVAAFAVAFGVAVEVSDHFYPISNYQQLQGVRDFIIGFDLGEYPQCDLANEENKS